MTTIITTKGQEESTYIVTAAFFDDDDDAVIPNAGLTWTLTDDGGTVINSRSAVAISEAVSVDIVLTGDDLKPQATESGEYTRHVLIEGTYDSPSGTDLPIKDDCRFEIEDLVGV